MPAKSCPHKTTQFHNTGYPVGLFGKTNKPTIFICNQLPVKLLVCWLDSQVNKLSNNFPQVVSLPSKSVRERFRTFFDMLFRS